MKRTLKLGKKKSRKSLAQGLDGDTKIILRSIDKMVAEDDYEQGEIGQSTFVMSDKVDERFNSFSELLSWVNSYIGLSSNPNDWYAMDPGRITTGALENAEGNPVDSGSAEFELWKDGDLTLYSAHYDLFVELAVVREPSVDEITEMSGIAGY